MSLDNYLLEIWFVHPVSLKSLERMTGYLREAAPGTIRKVYSYKSQEDLQSSIDNGFEREIKLYLKDNCLGFQVFKYAPITYNEAIHNKLYKPSEIFIVSGNIPKPEIENDKVDSFTKQFAKSQTNIESFEVEDTTNATNTHATLTTKIKII